MKVDYSYTIENKISLNPIISIIDLNYGGCSVTNDIENVVNEIISTEKIDDMKYYSIIYQDSNGIWDGWDYFDEKFISLGVETQEEAILKIKNY